MFSAMFSSLSRYEELFKKLIFTLFVLIVYRIGSAIPVPGVNLHALKEYMAGSSVAGGIFNFIDLFSAGALSQCTLFALGIMPAITASIMMQVAGLTIPSIEALSKEGEYGRSIINRYTRFLSLGLSVCYSIGYAVFLESNGLAFSPGFGFKALFVLSLVAGSMFVMWLGDQIKVLGVGNGSSMIIFAGIVARFPSHFSRTFQAVQVGSLSAGIAILILVVFLAIVAGVVFLEKGDRKVPINYARRVVGNRMYGAQTSYIPFKVNTVGVMPVIFANSFLNIPLFILKLLSKFPMFAWLAGVFDYRGAVYNLLLFGFIIFFTYMYTALVFNPQELSDNLKKSGAFVPGVRPGAQTASYFEYVLDRIGALGSLYLGTLAVLPNVIPYFIPAIPFDLGGTSLLIVVGVALEMITQVQSYFLQYSKYDAFTPSASKKKPNYGIMNK